MKEKDKKDTQLLHEDMHIEYLPINSLKPYEKNARKHDNYDIEKLKNSIREFGFNDPIGIWSDENIIVEGHGRLQACKELGFKEVMCIRLDHLNDEQRRAYTLAHNKTAENSMWDFDTLDEEINKLESYNMEDFGFIFNEPEEPWIDDEGNAYEFASDAEHVWDKFLLKYYHPKRAVPPYGMPMLKACTKEPPHDFLDFNNMSYYENHLNDAYTFGIRFYQDDSKEDKIWNNPDLYIEKITRFDSAVTPDFSLYLEMPTIIQIYNVWRRFLIGQIMEDNGINVYPEIGGISDPTLEGCFDGLEKGGIYAISMKGARQNEESMEWKTKDLDACLEKLDPKGILLFGGDLETYDWSKWGDRKKWVFSCPQFYKRKDK